MPTLWKGQATLPEKLRQRTLSELKPGTATWTVPWVMWADSEGNLWIDTDSPHWRRPARSKPEGTLQMVVKRIEHGFEVTLYEHHEYRLTKRQPKSTDLPVMKLHTW